MSTRGVASEILHFQLSERRHTRLMNVYGVCNCDKEEIWLHRGRGYTLPLEKERVVRSEVVKVESGGQVRSRRLPLRGGHVKKVSKRAYAGKR